MSKRSEHAAYVATVAILSIAVLSFAVVSWFAVTAFVVKLVAHSCGG